ncbi:hypothetical protein L9F63_001385 [Diploptera punctata]|uniref:GPI ethanolamine phosphate transferase 1 n=1 Tax=Diploptera punctata TaxID=6984 RepID=A0AAD8EJ52_DIPPU|nr:hypothetical protein L9F63_001385 [Diploptera punctata]
MNYFSHEFTTKIINLKMAFAFLCGILVHMICFVSVSDIYFRSTVVHGIMTNSSSIEAPARRVVFIVCDGLRADNFFEAIGTREGNTPYLRSGFSDNLQIVDRNVKILEDKIEKLYNYDKKTCYIFTADHGMTHSGSHGTGHPNETKVPLVAWGAGIHGPRSANQNELSSPTSWGLSHIGRYDINSIDLAPLLASLIGIPFPANSMGILPHVYLNVTEDQLSEIMLANTHQMLAQYRRKKEIFEREIPSFVLWKFPFNHKEETRLIKMIHSYIQFGKFNKSVSIIVC